MKRPVIKGFFLFILGMLTFAVGWFFVSTFVFVKRPTPPGIVEDWERICFWFGEGGIVASVSPKGCYSTTCTRPTMQSGTAVVDSQNYQIQLETRFSLVETSRFLLPCVKNCAGGGTVQFNLGPLVPNDYDVLFRGKEVGELMVFSGRVTPRQCFENTPGSGAQTVPNTSALDPNVHVNASGIIPENPPEETQTSQEDSPTDLCLQVKTTEMPVHEALGKIDDEIAAQLYSQYLEGYQSAALPDFCRLKAFDVKGMKVNPTRTSTNDLAEEADVSSLVESFGKRLAAVSLQSPNAAEEMKQQYVQFVSQDLLERWMSNPSTAPGRVVSSPWPDRIEITSLTKESTDSYIVRGLVIEVTSLEVVNGGAAAKIPAIIEVQKIQGRWVITGYREEG